MLLTPQQVEVINKVDSVWIPLTIAKVNKKGRAITPKDCDLPGSHKERAPA